MSEECTGLRIKLSFTDNITVQNIVIGVVFAIAGAIGLWGGFPERKLKSGEQPSMWALRAKVGFWLFLLIGTYVAVQGVLKMFGLVG